MRRFTTRPLGRRSCRPARDRSARAPRLRRRTPRPVVAPRLETCARRSRDEESRFDQWRIRTGLRRAVATANITRQSPQGRNGGNGGRQRTCARGQHMIARCLPRAVRKAVPDGVASSARERLAGRQLAGRRLIRTPHSSHPATRRSPRRWRGGGLDVATALSKVENIVNIFMGTRVIVGVRAKSSTTARARRQPGRPNPDSPRCLPSGAARTHGKGNLGADQEEAVAHGRHDRSRATRQAAQRTHAASGRGAAATRQ